MKKHFTLWQRLFGSLTKMCFGQKCTHEKTEICLKCSPCYKLHETTSKIELIPLEPFT